MSGVLADTNILLRYFLRDIPEQSDAVAAMLTGRLARGDPPPDVMPATISEMVFVASGRVYKRDRRAMVVILLALLDGGFGIVDRQVVDRAVRLYRDVHNDWDDCLLAAYAIERGDGTVISFDRGLDRMPGLTRVEPASLGEEETPQ